MTWAPDRVDAGVTQWRRRRPLGATQTVNHATDLLAVLDCQVPLWPQVHQIAEQAQPPQLPLRDLLDWQGSLFSPCTVFLHIFQPCDLSQVSDVLAGCGSWIFGGHPGKNSHLLTGRVQKLPKEGLIPSNNLIYQTDLVDYLLKNGIPSE